jgi:hypothetical protein
MPDARSPARQGPVTMRMKTKTKTEKKTKTRIQSG